MKITTDTGMVLDDDFGMTGHLTDWAEKREVDGKVYYCEQSNEYVLFVNNIPEFSSSRSEDVAVHIDMMSLAKEYEK